MPKYFTEDTLLTELYAIKCITKTINNGHKVGKRFVETTTVLMHYTKVICRFTEDSIII